MAPINGLYVAVAGQDGEHRSTPFFLLLFKVLQKIGEGRNGHGDTVLVGAVLDCNFVALDVLGQADALEGSDIIRVLG